MPPKHPLPAAGTPAPAFELEAVQSQRRIRIPDPRRRPHILLFHDHHTIAAVRDVQETVRTSYPAAADVVIASIADISVVPRMLRRMVEPVLNRAYGEASKYVPEGLDPADYVIILPDWKGRISAAYGVRDTGKEAVICVIGADGLIVGSQQGGALGETALALLAKSLASTKP